MRFFLLILLVLISLPSNSSTRVKIATDSWCPYVCNYDGQSSGILVDIVEKAFAEKGYLVDFVWLNWARAIREAREGEVQGIIGGFKSDSPDFIFGNEFLLYSQMCFYTSQQDSWQYKGTSSLNSRDTVIVNRYSYGEGIDAYIDANEHAGEENVTRVYGRKTIAQRLKLLAKRKVNTLIDDKLVVANVNKSLAEKDKLRLAGCLSPEKVYLAFSPNSNLSPRLSRAFDRGIQQLKQSGELKRIIAKYQ